MDVEPQAANMDVEPQAAQENLIWSKHMSAAHITISIVALIVVAAGIYTIPGGKNASGSPNKLKTPNYIGDSFAAYIGFAASMASLILFAEVAIQKTPTKWLPYELGFGLLLQIIGVGGTTITLCHTAMVLFDGNNLKYGLLCIPALVGISILANNARYIVMIRREMIRLSNQPPPQNQQLQNLQPQPPQIQQPPPPQAPNQLVAQATHHVQGCYLVHIQC